MNCVPLSDVMVSGTPKRLIQLWRKVEATLRAEVSAMGTASGQRVDLSIMVRI